ncbi:hypothetical protein BV923_21935 [Pectobacterium odoriferum]|uniref:hypothetical protein n=1 Tax=Pectobacterium odoriferum TaxID=78398 RepID=UPI000CD089D1|nr:hypothetical protein [Pectobacterium odoriferum]POE18027.1 hypothetical protein BV923_21935 [Pectobacterium odoriferum]
MVILVIAAIGIPSLNDVRLNRQIKVAKKHILQCLSQPDLSKEKKDEYNEMLADLDYQIIKSHNVKIKEIQDNKEHSE